MYTRIGLIRNMFLRDRQNHPVGCLAIVVDRDNHIAEYQLSVLNPMDRFVRKISRELAIGRLIEQPITVKLTNEATMHEISALIMRDIVARGIAPSRAIKAAKLWLHNNTDEYYQAAILSDFTDEINAYGANSQEVKAFYRRYENDYELIKLFDTVIKLKTQLQQTHGNIRDHRDCTIINAAKLTSFEF